MKKILLPLFCCLSILVVFAQSDSARTESEIEALDFPYTHIDELLQGRYPGTWVTQSSGIAGADFSVRVRGTGSFAAGTEPLYVINGLPIYNESRNSAFIYGPGTDLISTIDPKNIKSIEVLRNIQATALYGSRGANGVVIIETKDGSGQPFNVDAEFTSGTLQVFEQPSVLNASQFAQYLNETAVSKGLPQPYTQPASFGNGTDWNDRLYTTGGFRNYRIGLNGSSTQSTYSVYGSYLNQDGVTPNTGSERYNLQARLVSQASDKLTLNTSLILSRVESKGVISDRPDGSGVVLDANRFSPLLSSGQIRNYAIDDAGTVLDGTDGNPLALQSTGAINPIASANLASSLERISRAFASTQFSYDLTKSLRIESSVAADGIFMEDFAFFSGQLQPELVVGGMGANAKEQSLVWYNANAIEYLGKFDNEDQLRIKVGMEIQGSLDEMVFGDASGFDNETLGYNALGSGLTKNLGSNREKWSLFSVFGQVQYSIQKAYELSLSLRSDASSRFGGDYQLFPALGVSADLKEAGLIGGNGLLSNTKLYAGVGQSGNQQISPYTSQGSLNQSIYYLGNTQLKSFAPTRLANDLEMEKVNQFNVGALWTLLGQVEITTEFYSRNTTNALMQLPLSSYYLTESVLANAGEIKNSGFELGLNASGDLGPLRWGLSANAALNRSEVHDVPFTSMHGNEVNGIDGWMVAKEGEELGSIYGYRINGIISQDNANVPTLRGAPAQAGAYQYDDVNGDGIIDQRDKVVLGAVTPDLVYGITGSLAAFGFELQALFQGVSGNELVNFNRTVTERFDGTGNVAQSAYDNRWTTGNTSGTVAGAIASDGKIVDESLVEDGSYLRLKYLSFGYALPQKVLDVIKLSSLKVLVSGRNLLTITNYEGVDPEVSLFKSSTQSMGADFGGYPGAQLWTLGIKIGL